MPCVLIEYTASIHALALTRRGSGGGVGGVTTYPCLKESVGERIMVKH